eukprot:CAMPEP_0119125566 /NCGR_PEP_ID=MMETSP1310-20130426/4786_1 /TAXON_ID=464262 /ORGANISM="Genus nov. species nov., Strain RCC2339" /LENGTH=1515 /DNA_ID=CAMNT_0007115643 /DNA_START=146 /DNA_END=4693 /DNA_ORIENTATION=-
MAYQKVSESSGVVSSSVEESAPLLNADDEDVILVDLQEYTDLTTDLEDYQKGEFEVEENDEYSTWVSPSGPLLVSKYKKREVPDILTRLTRGQSKGALFGEPLYKFGNVECYQVASLSFSWYLIFSVESAESKVFPYGMKLEYVQHTQRLVRLLKKDRGPTATPHSEMITIFERVAGKSCKEVGMAAEKKSFLAEAKEEAKKVNRPDGKHPPLALCYIDESKSKVTSVSDSLFKSFNLFMESGPSNMGFGITNTQERDAMNYFSSQIGRHKTHAYVEVLVLALSSLLSKDGRAKSAAVLRKSFIVFQSCVSVHGLSGDSVMDAAFLCFLAHCAQQQLWASSSFPLATEAQNCLNQLMGHRESVIVGRRGGLSVVEYDGMVNRRGFPLEIHTADGKLTKLSCQSYYSVVDVMFKLVQEFNLQDERLYALFVVYEDIERSMLLKESIVDEITQMIAYGSKKIKNLVKQPAEEIWQALEKHGIKFIFKQRVFVADPNEYAHQNQSEALLLFHQHKNDFLQSRCLFDDDALIRVAAFVFEWSKRKNEEVTEVDIMRRSRTPQQVWDRSIEDTRKSLVNCTDDEIVEGFLNTVRTSRYFGYTPFSVEYYGDWSVPAHLWLCVSLRGVKIFTTSQPPVQVFSMALSKANAQVQPASISFSVPKEKIGVKEITLSTKEGTEIFGLINAYKAWLNANAWEAVVTKPNEKDTRGDGEKLGAFAEKEVLTVLSRKSGGWLLARGSSGEEGLIHMRHVRFLISETHDETETGYIPSPRVSARSRTNSVTGALRKVGLEEMFKVTGELVNSFRLEDLATVAFRRPLGDINMDQPPTEPLLKATGEEEESAVVGMLADAFHFISGGAGQNATALARSAVRKAMASSQCSDELLVFVMVHSRTTSPFLRAHNALRLMVITSAIFLPTLKLQNYVLSWLGGHIEILSELEEGQAVDQAVYEKYRNALWAQEAIDRMQHVHVKGKRRVGPSNYEINFILKGDRDQVEEDQANVLPSSPKERKVSRKKSGEYTELEEKKPKEKRSKSSKKSSSSSKSKSKDNDKGSKDKASKEPKRKKKKKRNSFIETLKSPLRELDALDAEEYGLMAGTSQAKSGEKRAQYEVLAERSESEEEAEEARPVEMAEIVVAEEEGSVAELSNSESDADQAEAKEEAIEKDHEQPEEECEEECDGNEEDNRKEEVEEKEKERKGSVKVQERVIEKSRRILATMYIAVSVMNREVVQVRISPSTTALETTRRVAAKVWGKEPPEDVDHFSIYKITEDYEQEAIIPSSHAICDHVSWVEQSSKSWKFVFRQRIFPLSLPDDISKEGLETIFDHCTYSVTSGHYFMNVSQAAPLVALHIHAVKGKCTGELAPGEEQQYKPPLHVKFKIDYGDAIKQEGSKIEELSERAAKLNYVRRVRRIDTFGGTFFDAMDEDVRAVSLVVCTRGIAIVSRQGRELYDYIPYQYLIKWRVEGITRMVFISGTKKKTRNVTLVFTASSSSESVLKLMDENINQLLAMAKNKVTSQAQE